ncbi:electron-transfer flavoprotein:ubiquinone oxidoreductase [Patulibacter sp.]|uniref:electron transfer flavoprotein-ubiquinone oxidoreductase n=1 Tax=Patulibacter sp. TaxID=1912859 RepID=UPI00271D3ADD|nr:electron-transfer flavoprotein:ubiquinone oxidoreductase [Patulibacter sp.]MDO9408519.1 electron-transfer flavoprotein:ubiquinone oxidoreductase [Patulibacter sp.]
MAASHNGGVAPSQFPPPVDVVEEFVAAPTDPEDERIEVGVAIVGGGPAGLACANRLLQLLAEDPELLESLGEVPVAVVEKGKVCGAHNMSGAVMKPGPFKTVFPDTDIAAQPWALSQCEDDGAVWLRNEKKSFSFPVTPPPFKNKGNWVISISQLCRWMAQEAEEAGAYILTETAASKLLVDGEAVVGIRTGDKGRAKDGSENRNFEPGMDMTAKATVLAEGTWGHLTGAAVKRFDLAAGKEPATWEIGAKEVWKVKKPYKKVVHTFGWPARPKKKQAEAGGGWIYPIGDDQVSIGYVVPLHTSDATMSVHDMLQAFKAHPYVREILEGGERTAWGAKAIQAGGYRSMPKLSVPGAVIAGECASMVDMARLKGVHMAIEAGRLAAESIFAQLKAGSNDFTGYETAIEDSLVGKTLREVKDNRLLLDSHSLPVGAALSGLDFVTKGKLPLTGGELHRDAEVAVSVPAKPIKDRYPQPDGKYFFDKLSSVFITGNATRDDAPSHIRIEKKVKREVAEAWAWMCPAGVYEIEDDQPKEGFVDVTVNYTNCVQCGAITARGGRLTPPEGGDGPAYQNT